jgi:isoamylase
LLPAYRLRTQAGDASQAFAALRRARFVIAQWNEELEVKDVTWINASGAEMQESDWTNGNMKCFGMLMNGQAQESDIKRPASDVTPPLIVNARHDVVQIRPPQVCRWRAGLSLD